MKLYIEELKKKYPNLDEGITNIEISSKELTDYFVSIIVQGKFTKKDLFFQSVVNRTNQCIYASNYCLINDLPFPLLNNIRQMIEIYAVNEFIIDDIKNFDRAFLGRKDHEDENLRMPNTYTIVQKLRNKEPMIVKVYDEYSELSHPNSRSVFSIFTPKKGEETEEGLAFTTSSHGRPLEEREAYHVIRNIGGIANRVLISTKKINPLAKYITMEEFAKQLKDEKNKS